MIYLDIDCDLNIPATVVRCPDCGGVLSVEVTEYEPESGEITEGGFDITCGNEDVDPDSHLERWQVDWIPVEAKIYQWLLDNVRVAQCTKRHLSNWMEAIKDWGAVNAIR